MLWNIALLLFPIVLLAAALCCYKRRSGFMTRFYLRMLRSYNCRKLYTRLVVQLMLVYHFLYVSATCDARDLLLSTLICIAMFSHRKAERLMDYFHAGRARFTLMCATLVSAFVPHLFPLAITWATLLIATLFYPGRTARDTILRVGLSDDALLRLYYDD